MLSVETIATEAAGDAAPQTARHLIDRFFFAPGLSALPQVLQAPVFLAYLQHGRRAIQALQRAIAAQGADCAVDGVIGPLTLRSVRACLNADASPFHSRLREEIMALNAPQEKAAKP
ncbi:MAG: putative peptidoglycan-binding domain-containing protein [Paracoccaceae bacterium]